MSRQMNRRAVLAGTAALAPVAAVPVLASPDAELIALGERLRVAYAAERAASARGASDEEVDAAMDACSEIVEAIVARPATTFAGLQVKGLAIAWCCNDEPFGEFGDTTDRRVVASLLADLQAMGASS